MAYVEENKRLVKNTAALYFRTFFVMLVSLFSSRILLKALGVDDFGIYNLVGSIVVLFSFLNTAMTQAIQRYLTIEIGKEDIIQLREIFKVSITSLLIIIVIIVVVLETIGLWFLDNKLNIPAGHLYAAKVTFQFSMATFVINTLRVPYESIIIAYERMTFFAYVSIVDSILKLIIVLSLRYTNADNLIMYSGLLAVESIFIFVIYLLFCEKQYKGTTPLKLSYDGYLLKSIFTFSGWSLLGSTTNVVTQKGFIFLINIYYGVVANAAMGIATQVSGAVSSFINSFQTSFRPQIVKAYALDDRYRLNNLVTKTSKFSFALVILPVIWLITNMPFVLKLWLNEVPEYTVAFCRLILICLVFDATSGPYNCAIMARGKIKIYQILISVSFLIDIVGSYVIIKIGIAASYVLIMRILTRGLLNMIIGLAFLKDQLNFNINFYLKSVILPIIYSLLLIIPLLYWLSELQFTALNLLLISSLYVICVGLPIVFFVLLNRNERHYIISTITSVIKR